MFKSKTTLALCAVAAICAANPARAEDQDLQATVRQLSARVAELEQQQNQNWMTDARAAQIRAIVDSAIADARTCDKSLPLAGYNNGFYIQSPDANFRLAVGGIMQLRYTFAQDHFVHGSDFATKPRSGNASGFDIRRARIIFSGNAFSPNVTFNISGDFGCDFAGKSDQSFFQLQDAYIAYRFNDALNFRVGSFVTPFSRAEYTFAGQEFVDFPTVLIPFDPIRSLGASLFGQPVKDRWSYELNMNNGQKTNNLGRVSEINTSSTSPFTGATDNRLAFYARTQFVGAGKIADFLDEPDRRADNSSLAWQLGAAAGYESANTSKDAFPSPQGNATIPGLSTQPSPGFAGAIL
ncbi:MAG: porin [Phycisphaerae bacterium]